MPPVEQIFKCLLCSKSFSSPLDLRQHIEAKVMKPHQCSICGKGFDAKLQLLRHEKVHETVRRHFRCSGCNRPFARKDQLNRHLPKCIYKLHVWPNQEEGGDYFIRFCFHFFVLNSVLFVYCSHLNDILEFWKRLSVEFYVRFYLLVIFLFWCSEQLEKNNL